MSVHFSHLKVNKNVIIGRKLKITVIMSKILESQSWRFNVIKCWVRNPEKSLFDSIDLFAENNFILFSNYL